MRPYLISAWKREAPPQFREWFDVVIEALGVHSPDLPESKVSWRVRHSIGEISGVGPYRGPEVRLIQADVDVRFPQISEVVAESWVLLQSVPVRPGWQLDLDEIQDGGVLMKAGRDFILVQRSLRTVFDEVALYPTYINKILGREFVRT